MSGPWWLLQGLADVPDGDEWLTPAERVVLAGLAVPKRRSDWRLGRWTAKALLASLFGCSAGEVEVLAAEDGAPEARVDGRLGRARVSISHRDGRSVAVASTDGSLVGCDLEVIEPRSDAFVEEWLDEREQAALDAIGLPRSTAVNLVWTGKEAAAKVLRGGLRLDVRHLVVGFASSSAEVGQDGWAPLRVTCAPDRQVLSGWWRVVAGDVVTIVGDPAPRPPRQRRPEGLGNPSTRV